MKTAAIEKMSAHWLLAKIGKKVLRPGGLVLTQKMLKMLDINSHDRIVEFAPGIGFTAKLTLKKNPESYTGIDAEQEAVDLLKKNFINTAAQFKLGNAAHSDLAEQSANKVYGEAMLSMHSDHRKSEIIREASRILVPKGYYAIHELALAPDSLDENVKLQIQKELALSLKVNTRPLTVSEWTQLLEKEGFQILKTETAPMHLLELQRIISDEGLSGFLKIAGNIIIQPKIRSRILQMRRVFKKHNNCLCAVAILAQKK
ncbi:class I SAM-dependent methyltransferase [Chryseobacterium sp. BIGb0232]|uniref:class I SAM-dependent methyltransferase n=1 Tax=Chryseobacterium sp. BIGb0232 TaxID=2940598 RepID=UPI000F485BA1|nr:class I SAM-dependent methyltransferase [Chryseobacterium sp. BIGb0232]MCS4301841.1 ubiquinone/menaquinone biosynthesis C-methylase UbiE [Chryseobacterium sp. BIGb0232]ROS17788.1 methyltransferase family protein [Chryseobacterium nakagawai]